MSFTSEPRLGLSNFAYSLNVRRSHWNLISSEMAEWNFFKCDLNQSSFGIKENDLLSPWWKNHFPLSHSWIYKFYWITVRYWKMLILRTTEIHFRTLVSHPKENMLDIISMRDPERFFSQILCAGECPQGWVCTQVYIILPLFWT